MTETKKSIMRMIAAYRRQQRDRRSLELLKKASDAKLIVIRSLVDA